MLLHYCRYNKEKGDNVKRRSAEAGGRGGAAGGGSGEGGKLRARAVTRTKSYCRISCALPRARACASGKRTRGAG